MLIPPPHFVPGLKAEKHNLSEVVLTHCALLIAGCRRDSRCWRPELPIVQQEVRHGPPEEAKGVSGRNFRRDVSEPHGAGFIYPRGDLRPTLDGQ